jgi:hypothetical protein
MVAAPAAIPVTTPVPAPIVAFAVLLLLHAPPPVASFKVVVEETQTVDAPVMAAGKGLMVTAAETAQPVANV